MNKENVKIEPNKNEKMANRLLAYQKLVKEKKTKKES